MSSSKITLKLTLICTQCPGFILIEMGVAPIFRKECVRIHISCSVKRIVVIMETAYKVKGNVHGSQSFPEF